MNRRVLAESCVCLWKTTSTSLLAIFMKTYHFLSPPKNNFYAEKISGACFLPQTFKIMQKNWHLNFDLSSPLSGFQCNKQHKKHLDIKVSLYKENLSVKVKKQSEKMFFHIPYYTKLRIPKIKTPKIKTRQN